jgi:hypothetical protein
MISYPVSNFASNNDDSQNILPFTAFAQVDDEIDDEDIELKGTIILVNDNGSFDLETVDGIKTILVDEDTVIDDGLELSEIVGFEVDIDVVNVDGSLLATEIEFDDKSNEKTDELENIDDGNESEANKEIQKADREIQKAEQKITDASNKGKDTELAELKLDEAKELLVLSKTHFDSGDFNEAEELAEDAKDLASESRMKYLGKTIGDLDNEKQSEKDKKLTKEQEKRDKKIVKAAQKLEKAQERLAEKLTKLETKLSEKAQISEERANKILEKIAKETQKNDKRVQKLIEKFQSGKYFGDNKNTDKETNSFTITFDGTATEIGDQSNIQILTGELFLENLLTGSNSKKFRVTGGEIFVGDSEVFDVIFGKARLSSSGQGGEKNSMIIIAQVSDGVDVRTLKISVDLSEELDSKTESSEIEILFPRSKIASLWFLSAIGDMGLTTSVPDDVSVIDDTVDDTIPVPDDVSPDNSSDVLSFTISTDQNSYFTGDEIVISGNVGEIIADLPIVLQIVTVTDLIEIAQFVPESDGSFSYPIQAGGPQWLETGTVIIKAFYGENTVESSFEFTVN